MTDNRVKKEFPNFIGYYLTHKHTLLSFSPFGLQQLLRHGVPGVMTVTAKEPCCQFSKRLTTGLAFVSKGILQQPKAKLLFPSSFSKRSNL